MGGRERGGGRNEIKGWKEEGKRGNVFGLGSSFADYKRN